MAPLAPAVLVARAHENGVRVLALTDHDTLEGLAEARAAADELGMQLINGIELSCTWGGATIHVLGYGFDVDAPPLREAIEQLHDRPLAAGRRNKPQAGDERYARCARRCACGAAGTGRQRKCAGPTALCRLSGRDQGFVKDRAEAFRKWLGAGKLGDVKQHWPTLEDTVAPCAPPGPGSAWRIRGITISPAASVAS